MSMTYEECRYSRPGKPVPEIPDNVMHQFRMNDKVCIITGASRGIGASVTEGFAQAGAHIIMVSSSENPAMSQTAKDLAQSHNVKALSLRCDVTDVTAVQQLVATVLVQFGKIDVFIANAGVCNPKPILEQSLEEYHAQMNVNTHGVVHCAKSVGPVFMQQGFGSFIITTSISGRVVTIPVDHTTYNTSKAAALQLGRSLAREWREFARVNMVSPGWIDTDMSGDAPSINEARRMAVMGRLGDAPRRDLWKYMQLTELGHVKEMKAAYLYLASDASSFVTGSELIVDGGYSLP